MDKFEIELLAEQVAQKVLAKHYQILGYDTNSSDDIKRLQTNLVWVDKSRLGNEEVYKWVRRSAIGVAVTGFLGIVLKGLQSFF